MVPLDLESFEEIKIPEVSHTKSKYRETLDKFLSENMRNAKIVFPNKAEAHSAGSHLRERLMPNEDIEISSRENVVYLMKRK